MGRLEFHAFVPEVPVEGTVAIPLMVTEHCDDGSEVYATYAISGVEFMLAMQYFMTRGVVQSA